MNPRWIAFFKLVILFIVVIALILLFPPVLEFVEMGARELRYLWWLVLLLALAVWLIWGLGKKKE
jgi:type VI protein secretion system component VasK